MQSPDSQYGFNPNIGTSMNASSYGGGGGGYGPGGRPGMSQAMQGGGGAPGVASPATGSMTGGWDPQRAQAFYNTYQGMQPGGQRDALIKSMQGSDNGAAFNNAMRQGGNVLSGSPTGEFSYSGGHQAAPSNPWSPGSPGAAGSPHNQPFGGDFANLASLSRQLGEQNKMQQAQPGKPMGTPGMSGGNPNPNVGSWNSQGGQGGGGGGYQDFGQWSSQQPYPSGKLDPYGPYANPNSPASQQRNLQLLTQFMGSQGGGMNPSMSQFENRSATDIRRQLGL